MQCRPPNILRRRENSGSTCIQFHSSQLKAAGGKLSISKGLTDLPPLNGQFTEGFDTADLKEANSLLDELS